MWNQPCYNVPPNLSGGWVYIPAGGPTSPVPTSIPSSKSSLKKQLKQLERDTEAFRLAIKEMDEKKRKDKKPEDNKGLGIIHQSMLLMMTAFPLGILDLLLIRALHQ